MTLTVVRPSIVFASVLALAACAIPPKPDAPRLRAQAPVAEFATDGRWPAADWWKRYRDPQLDDLEERALASAPALDEAQRRFEIALRSVDVASAEGGFSAQANAQVQRQRLSENGLIPPRFLGFTWYNQGDLSLQFKYDFDFWGKTRAAVAAAVDEAHAAQAERSAARLLVSNAVADTYFGWQADQAHLALARDTLAALERSRALEARRVERGIDPPDALHQGDAQIAAAREQVAGYAGAGPVRLAALAALIGIAPAGLPPLERRALPAVDPRLPADLGTDLIARRPEIVANRWRVEAALRRVDRARAEFYPDISLGALVGLQSVDLDKLFNAGSRMGGFGPALHLPVFALGGLHAAYGVSQAQLAAAAARYDASVVDAARDVSTQALGLQQVEARRRERARQLDATRALERSAQARARRGLADDRSLLAARVQVLAQRDAMTTLDAQAVSGELALVKALGGGYRSDADAAADAATSVPSPARVEAR
jgi:multidrug efflux system outer membrane protein